MDICDASAETAADDCREATRIMLYRAIGRGLTRRFRPTDDEVIRGHIRSLGVQTVRSFEYDGPFDVSDRSIAQLPEVIRELRASVGTTLDIYEPDWSSRANRRRNVAMHLAAGTQTRTSNLPFRMILLDQIVTFLSVDFHDPREGFYEVRDADMTRSLSVLFSRTWRHGARLVNTDTGNTNRIPVDLVDVLEQLVSGAPDDRACLRLGLSLRTYRRRVNDVMDLLGASNRFAAGVAAAERGYVELLRVSRGPDERPDP
jgi:hypothetical protein